MRKPPFYIVTLVLFFLISATPLHFAQAQTALTIGETSVVTSNDSGNGNLLIAQQTTLSQSATIQSLSFYVTTASGDLRLGIYDATGSSGGPGAKIAETNSFTPSIGWNTANVITPVLIPAGAYWLAYLPSSSSLAFKLDYNGSAKWYSYAYGVMPATFSPSPTGSDLVHWSFYATLNTSTSPDTTAPSIPTGLTTTAVSSSQINLSWSASTDNVGVTGYNIYRNNIQIASVANTSYNDTGLTASTAYSYTVAAYDATGNTSTQSAYASATTQTGGSVTNPIDSLQPGQWYMVPNSNVSAIDPCPTRDCNYSGNGGQKDVIRSWNGGAYDTKRDQLIVWGGGHAAYFGNELYGFNVNTLKWAMLTTPSMNISLNGEAYPDGRPNARHTYSGVLYAANVDKFWASSGSVGDSGGCSSGTWMYDFSALPPESGWARQLDYPGNDAKCGAVSAYDPATGLVWFNGKSGLYTFNPSNISSPWVQHNNEFSVPLYISAAIDTKRKKLVMIGGGYAFIHDISSSGTVLRQNMTTSGAKEIESAAAPGLAYDPVSDRMIAWNGGSNVYVLNMDTMVWENRAPAGSNTVTPTQVTASGGTFSRFQYIPSKNAFIAVNATTENIYIYKLSSGGGITPLPTVSLGASPTSVTSGSSSTLSWSSTNATSCTASGGWSGAKGTSGTQSITNITTTATYTLSCTGTGGTTNASVTITVTAAGDTTPPTTPASITATAVSTSQINLSWSASTDNVGVTGYDIYRGGTPLITVTGTSYTNTGLTASTLYSYTVRAIDAAGNSSAQSTAVSATTAAQTALTIGEIAVLTSNDSGNGNLLIAQQTTLSQSATIQSLSFYVTTASGDLRLGIYDATGSSGGPGAKIAETNSFTPTTGWNTANVIAPVSLPAGAYWLAYLPSSSSLAFKKILTGSAKWYSYTYGVMPTTYSTAPSGSDSVHWSFYATLNTSTSATI